MYAPPVRQKRRNTRRAPSQESKEGHDVRPIGLSLNSCSRRILEAIEVGPREIGESSSPSKTRRIIWCIAPYLSMSCLMTRWTHQKMKGNFQTPPGL